MCYRKDNFKVGTGALTGRWLYMTERPESIIVKILKLCLTYDAHWVITPKAAHRPYHSHNRHEYWSNKENQDEKKTVFHFGILKGGKQVLNGTNVTCKNWDRVHYGGHARMSPNDRRSDCTKHTLRPPLFKKVFANTFKNRQARCQLDDTSVKFVWNFLQKFDKKVFHLDYYMPFSQQN